MSSTGTVVPPTKVPKLPLNEDLEPQTPEKQRPSSSNASKKTHPTVVVAATSSSPAATTTNAKAMVTKPAAKVKGSRNKKNSQSTKATSTKPKASGDGPEVGVSSSNEVPITTKPKATVAVVKVTDPQKADAPHPAEQQKPVTVVVVAEPAANDGQATPRKTEPAAPANVKKPLIKKSTRKPKHEGVPRKTTANRTEFTEAKSDPEKSDTKVVSEIVGPQNETVPKKSPVLPKARANKPEIAQEKQDIEKLGALKDVKPMHTEKFKLSHQKSVGQQSQRQTKPANSSASPPNVKVVPEFAAPKDIEKPKSKHQKPTPKKSHDGLDSAKHPSQETKLNETHKNESFMPQLVAVLEASASKAPANRPSKKQSNKKAKATPKDESAPNQEAAVPAGPTEVAEASAASALTPKPIKTVWGGQAPTSVTEPPKAPIAISLKRAATPPAASSSSEEKSEKGEIANKQPKSRQGPKKPRGGKTKSTKSPNTAVAEAASTSRDCKGESDK